MLSRELNGGLTMILFEGVAITAMDVHIRIQGSQTGAKPPSDHLVTF